MIEEALLSKHPAEVEVPSAADQGVKQDHGITGGDPWRFFRLVRYVFADVASDDVLSDVFSLHV